jgi:hypothetical protein
MEIKNIFHNVREEELATQKEKQSEVILSFASSSNTKPERTLHLITIRIT